MVNDSLIGALKTAYRALGVAVHDYAPLAVHSVFTPALIEIREALRRHEAEQPQDVIERVADAIDDVTEDRRYAKAAIAAMPDHFRDLAKKTEKQRETTDTLNPLTEKEKQLSAQWLIIWKWMTSIGQLLES